MINKCSLDKLAQYIESLVFASSEPVSVKDIRSILKEHQDLRVKENEIEDMLHDLMKKYSNDEYSFEMVAIAGGYQFMSKGAYHGLIASMLKLQTQKRLSKAALETLSIIAYKQPVTKTEVEHIRGVNCDYSIQKLLEKELVVILGRHEGPGRPILYGTSEKFMDHFGLKDIGDLPQTKDIQREEQSIGEPAPIEEKNYDS